MTLELAAQGMVIERKTVVASILRQGLEGNSPSMFTRVTTIQGPAARGFAECAQRRWDLGCPDPVWIREITFLPTGAGGLRLAAVRDRHSRRVLGNVMAESFWATLKIEFCYRRPRPTRAEARRKVARWIEIVLNRRWLHSSLVTPARSRLRGFKRNQAGTEEHADQAQVAGLTVNRLRADPAVP